MGDIGCGGIQPLLEEGNGLGYHRFLFAVQGSGSTARYGAIDV